MAKDPPQLLLVRYCSDAGVQRFCEVETLDFNPKTSKSACELFEAARARYTDRRCLDLCFYEH
jgi:hypothetical protein